MQETQKEIQEKSGKERVKMFLQQIFSSDNLRFFGLLIAVVIITLILFRTILFMGWVPSESMEPTINVNDLFIATRHVKNIKDGDILIFKMDDRYLIKRVYASEGERITLTDDHQVTKGKNGETKVPKGTYFMCGDNKDNSFDSRYWENPFLQKRNIVAKYRFKIPTSKIFHNK